MLLVLATKEIVKDNIVIADSIEPVVIEESLKERFGEEYYEIYDYKYITIKDKSLVLIKRLTSSKLDVPELFGTNDDIVQGAVNYVKKFDYTKYISNPSILKDTEEGNCQALSLYFKTIMDFYGINNNLVGDSEHVYNVVEFGDSVYTIDFSKEEINIEGGID